MKWKRGGTTNQWLLYQHGGNIVGIVQIDLDTLIVHGYVRLLGSPTKWQLVVESAEQNFERVKQQVEMYAALES